MRTAINDAVMCPFCGECALQFEARHKSPHFKWLQLDTDCEADIEQLLAVGQNPHNRSWVRTRRAPSEEAQRSHGGRRLLSVRTCSDCHQSKATRSGFDTGCPPDFLQCILNVPFEQMASLSLLTPVMSFSAAAARGRYVSGAQVCMCCCRLLSLVWLHTSADTASWLFEYGARVGVEPIAAAGISGIMRQTAGGFLDPITSDATRSSQHVPSEVLDELLQTLRESCAAANCHWLRDYKTCWQQIQKSAFPIVAPEVNVSVPLNARSHWQMCANDCAKLTSPALLLQVLPALRRAELGNVAGTQAPAANTIINHHLHLLQSLVVGLHAEPTLAHCHVPAVAANHHRQAADHDRTQRAKQQRPRCCCVQGAKEEVRWHGAWCTVVAV